jgi:glutamate---cysteine ligase / carboxylate-amine ligase
MDFRASEPLTYGLELELQIVDRATGRLTPGCVTLLDALARQGPAGHYAQEATLATIELNSSVQRDAAGMAAEMDSLVRRAREAARAHGFDLRGGGTHLAQFWNERVMSSTARAQLLEQRFGFLPKRFSTYGMHVHVGMPDAESAIQVANLLQALSPLFIALAAASPFLQLADTGFASSRPLEPLVYPHGGPMPFLRNWQHLQEELEALYATGVAFSLKDIYWDVRPKPEFGTVEVRVFDTPLSLGKALRLASLTRNLAGLVLQGRLRLAQPVAGSAQRVSRFMACRHGMDARLYHPIQATWLPAGEWLAELIDLLAQELPVPEDVDQIADWRALLEEPEEHAQMRATWAACGPQGPDPDALQAALVRHSDAICERLLT